MHRIYKWLFCAAVLFVALVPAKDALASIPYRTFSFDQWGNGFRVQPAYVPDSVIGYDLLEPNPSEAAPANLTFGSPEDLFIDRQDNLYIADTANDRIVKLDASFSSTNTP